jgi:hypothetical protein
LAVKDPDCTEYILCQVNSLNKEELQEFQRFKTIVGRLGSYVAAWYIALDLHRPYWPLYTIANFPYDCEMKFPEQKCLLYEHAFRLKQPKIKHTEL